MGLPRKEETRPVCSKTLIVASEVLGLKRMLRAFAPSASLFKVGVEALIKQKPADWRIRIGD